MSGNSGREIQRVATARMLTPEGSPEVDLHDPERWFLTGADTDIDHW